MSAGARCSSEADGLKAERNTASKRIGEAVRGGADPNGAEVAGLKQASVAAGERDHAARRGHRRGRGASSRSCCCGSRTRPTRMSRSAARRPTSPSGSGATSCRASAIEGEVGADAAAGPGAGTLGARPHWEVADGLEMFDLERGAKIAGSGFPVYRGHGAALQRALIDLFLETSTSREHGMTEIWPPAVVNADSARGTGQIPDKEDQMYVATRDDLYLVPTAEVPVTNLHRDEILDPDELPIRYAAYSPCFRREAGAAGRDTRGILRVHQFDKVEMVFFERPEDSERALEQLTAFAEVLLQRLGLAYRVLLMSTRRDGLRAGEEVRPRGLGARRRALARGELVLELPRLPGAPDGDPLPPDGRRAARARAHAQWLGARAAARGRRAARDVPGTGRLAPACPRSCARGWATASSAPASGGARPPGLNAVARRAAGGGTAVRGSVRGQSNWHPLAPRVPVGAGDASPDPAYPLPRAERWQSGRLRRS